MKFEDIFRDYSNYIYNYALKLTCHPDDAMDISQETFVKAWQNLDGLRDDNSVGKWLRTICYNEFLMKIRKEHPEQTLITDDWAQLESDGLLLTDYKVTPEDEVIVADEIRNLQNGCFFAMVRRLTLNQRIAFSLVDMFGLDIEYVATVLDITKGAAKGLLYRARMNIDSFFADHCSIINEKNPCSCQAWIYFSTTRENLQKNTHKLVTKLDYQSKGYTYNEAVRTKIQYLYSNMPEYKPSDEWYKNVQKIISQN